MLKLEDLKTTFTKIGLKKDMTIEVHSSLSSLENVDGGAYTIINSLKNIISNKGTIIMPSFTLSKPYPITENDKMLGIKYKKRILDEDSLEKSDMGIIPDTFRLMPDVKTGTGLHRFSGWGNKANKYTESVNDFFEIINDGGYGLLIGVGLDKLSSMHSVENFIPEKLWNYLLPHTNEIKQIYNEKDWFILTNEPYNRNWLKVQETCINKGIITELKINKSTFMFFKLKPVIEIYKNEILNDPYKLFDIKE